MRINNKIFLSLASLLLGLCAKAENLSDLKVPNAKITRPIYSKVQQLEGNDGVCSTNSANSALVIIDMQPYFANRAGVQNTPENKKKIENVITMQIASINKAKEAHIPIIFLEYDCPQCDPTTSALKAAVSDYKNARFIKKNTDGMLERSNKYRKELVDFLKQNSVSTLIITGANGGACVFRSITGALDNNCNVVALNSGIADFNYEEFIYPYAGYYSKIKPSCKDCSFKEVSSVERVADFMVNSKSLGRSQEQNALGTR